MASPPDLASLAIHDHDHHSNGHSPPTHSLPPRFRNDDQPAFRLPSPPSHQLLYSYNNNHQHQQPPPPLPNGPYSPIGSKKQPARAGLPAQWLDAIPDPTSTSPAPGDYNLGSPPQGALGSQGSEDDIIPTAIVIKNIPFNVKRETLLDIITSLNIPTPYAFNYHLDALGAFRGLAFANFRAAADADAVVAALNGFDVQGRKLRVEYKKVLQAGEKERIEREKALRRMRSMGFERPPPNQQIQPVQMPVPSPWGSHDDMSNGLYSTQALPAMPALQVPPPPLPAPAPTISPPPLSSTPSNLSAASSIPPPKEPLSRELDLNDPSTLDIYSRILVFKEDRMRDELAFSRSLSPRQRRVVHLVAQKLGVYHYSVGEGEDRYAVVTRDPPEGRAPVPMPTTRASVSGASGAGARYVPARTASYLTPDASPTPTLAASLRLKKSMPSLRPSPSSHAYSHATLHSTTSPFSSSHLSPSASFPVTSSSSSNTSPAMSLRRSNSSLQPSPHPSSNPHYATISTSTPPRPRQGSTTFEALFGTPILPPVPPLPGVERQPRGPASSAGFVGRSRVVSGNTAPGPAPPTDQALEL